MSIASAESEPVLTLWRNSRGLFGWEYREPNYRASSTQPTLWTALKTGAATGCIAAFRRQKFRPISHRHAPVDSLIPCSHCGDPIDMGDARRREKRLCDACLEDLDDQQERENRERADEDYAATRRYYGS